MPYASSLSGIWIADPAHSTLGFVARHAVVTRIRGKFTDFDIRIDANADDVAASSVTAKVRVASVETNQEQRDQHLRSADFFDVQRWPEMTFVSTGVDEVDEDSLLIQGDLTIRDVTRSISLPMDFLGVQYDPLSKVERASFEGSRRINRQDFGLKWNVPLDTGGVLVSERITIEYSISAVREQSIDEVLKSAGA
ncbi:YceI family protein [Granulicoccus phenolivorans]|uniref:YceI family protein n=1 Tax=Granulicoccus phenolivorans TaxID=266854 RepID=UPI0004177DB6|nr:YceI family protein [Granulicoccus phenolivorans]